jgi:hypothetical protein
MFMQITGPEMELYPLTKLCSYSTGVYIGPYLSGSLKLAMALPLLVCYKKEARHVLLLCCVFQSYAFFLNMESFEYLAARIPQEFWWNLK